MSQEPEPQNQDPLSDPGLTPQDECPHTELIHLYGIFFKCVHCKLVISNYDDE